MIERIVEYFVISAVACMWLFMLAASWGRSRSGRFLLDLGHRYARRQIAAGVLFALLGLAELVHSLTGVRNASYEHIYGAFYLTWAAWWAYLGTARNQLRERGLSLTGGLTKWKDIAWHEWSEGKPDRLAFGRSRWWGNETMEVQVSPERRARAEELLDRWLPAQNTPSSRG